jgi:hypothetical protein
MASCFSIELSSHQHTRFHFTKQFKKETPRSENGKKGRCTFPLFGVNEVMADDESRQPSL